MTFIVDHSYTSSKLFSPKKHFIVFCTMVLKACYAMSVADPGAVYAKTHQSVTQS